MHCRNQAPGQSLHAQGRGQRHIGLHMGIFRRHPQRRRLGQRTSLRRDQFGADCEHGALTSPGRDPAGHTCCTTCHWRSSTGVRAQKLRAGLDCATAHRRLQCRRRPQQRSISACPGCGATPRDETRSQRLPLPPVAGHVSSPSIGSGPAPAGRPKRPAPHGVLAVGCRRRRAGTLGTRLSFCAAPFWPHHAALATPFTASACLFREAIHEFLPRFRLILTGLASPVPIRA